MTTATLPAIENRIETRLDHLVVRAILLALLGAYVWFLALPFYNPESDSASAFYQAGSEAWRLMSDRLSPEEWWWRLKIAGVAVTGALMILLTPRVYLKHVIRFFIFLMFAILPFVFSRETKENFLLVKETYFRLIVIALFAIFLWRSLIRGELWDRLRAVPLPISLFPAIALVTVIWAVAWQQSLFLSLVLVSYYLFYLLVSAELVKPWHYLVILDLYAITGLHSSLYGIVQYHNLDPLFGIGEVIGNQDRKRLFSFFGNPVFLGVFLDAALPIALAIFFSAFARMRDWESRVEAWIARAAVVSAVVATWFCIIFYATGTGECRAHGITLSAYTQQQSQAASRIVREVSDRCTEITLLGLVFPLLLLACALPIVRYFPAANLHTFRKRLLAVTLGIGVLAFAAGVGYGHINLPKMEAFPSFIVQTVAIGAPEAAGVQAGSPEAASGSSELHFGGISRRAIGVGLATFLVFLLSALAIVGPAAFPEHSDRRWMRALIGGYSFLGILYCLYLTFTRTAWIATAFALTSFLILAVAYAHDLIYQGRRYILGFLAAMIFVSAGIGYAYFGANVGSESIEDRLTSSFTVLQRLMLFDITLNMIKDYPILGLGCRGFGVLYPLYQAKFYDGEMVLIPQVNRMTETRLGHGTLEFIKFAWRRCMPMSQAALKDPNIPEAHKHLFSAAKRNAILLFLIVGVCAFVLLTIYWNDLGHARALGIGALVYLVPLAVFLADFNGESYTPSLLAHPVMSPDPADYHWLAAGFEHVHNEYLQVWADLGLAGLAAFTAMFGLYFLRGIRLLSFLRERESEYRFAIIGLLAAVVAGLGEALANFPWQRIMPVLITVVAFAAIHNGQRIFLRTEDEDEGAAPESDSDPYPTKAAARSARGRTGGPRGASDVLSEADWANAATAFAVAASTLVCLYLPIKFVWGNISLKSGHTYIQQGALYRDNAMQRPDQRDRVLDMAENMTRVGLAFLDLASRLVPWNSETWFWYGDTLRVRGKYAEAVAVLKQALRHSNTKHIYFSLGTCYSMLADEAERKGDGAKQKEYLDLAARNWDQSRRMNPNFSTPYFHLGALAFRRGQTSEAVSLLKGARRWEGESSNPETLRLLGISQYVQNDATGAVETLEKALSIAPGLQGVQKYLGGAYHRRGQIDRALAAWEQALGERPDRPDPEISDSVLTVLASQGKVDRIREIFPAQNKALGENSVDYHRKFAELLKRAGDVEGARFELSRAQSIAPGSVETMRDLAALLFDARDFKGAEALFTKLAEIDSSRPGNRFNRGVCRYELGRKQEALEDWKWVRSVAPTHPRLDQYLKLAEEAAAPPPSVATAPVALSGTAAVTLPAIAPSPATIPAELAPTPALR